MPRDASTIFHVSLFLLSAGHVGMQRRVGYAVQCNAIGCNAMPREVAPRRVASRHVTVTSGVGCR